MKLLHIDSSALGQNSVTRELSAAIVSQWTSTLDGVQVEYRDLDREPLPHLTGGSLAQADPAEAADAERTLQQFLDADVVVIGAPMYNFGIPHQLKAWIDSILVARRTFQYSEKGPEGLAGGRRVFVVYSSGGIHGAGSDFVEPYLRTVFRMVGIDDITVIRVEGVAITPEMRQKAIDAALASIPALVAKAA